MNIWIERDIHDNDTVHIYRNTASPNEKRFHVEAVHMATMHIDDANFMLGNETAPLQAEFTENDEIEIRVRKVE